MIGGDTLATLFRRAVSRAENANILKAVIGDNDGNVFFTNANGDVDDGYVYVRIESPTPEAASPVRAIIRGAAPNYGTPVDVKRLDNGQYVVIGVDDERVVQFTNGNIGLATTGPHAATHLWPAVDTLPIDSRQMAYFRVLPSSGLTVAVSAGYTYASGTLDLTSNVPGTANEHRLAIIGYDTSSNALTTTNSSTKNVLVPFTRTEAEAVSLSDGVIPLAAVNLRNGQTSISLVDIAFDMRPWLVEAGTGLDQNQQIINLADTAVTPGSYTLTDLTVDQQGRITAAANGTVDLTSDVTGVLPIANGGTNASTAANARTELGLGTIATQNAGAVDIDGGTIDGTTIGATTRAAANTAKLTVLGAGNTSATNSFEIDNSDATAGMFLRDDGVFTVTSNASAPVHTLDSDTNGVTRINVRNTNAGTSAASLLQAQAGAASDITTAQFLAFPNNYVTAALRGAVMQASGRDLLFRLDSTARDFKFLQNTTSLVTIDGATPTTVDISGDLDITGALSKGSGSFDIDHPIRRGYRLRHSFTESPEGLLVYRGRATLSGGSATINLDQYFGMTRGTFVALCDVEFADVFVNRGNVEGEMQGATLTLTSADNADSRRVAWLVCVERRDDVWRKSKMTDRNGKLIIEYKKENV